MKNFRNKNVLITGGASGIGKLMGEIFLSKGAQLIIWDISEANIASTLLELESKGKVTAYKVDISDLNAIQATADLVRQECGPIDVLINNAGIVVGKYFHEHSLTEITKTMDINANAPMYITSQFLNDMIERKSGYVCTIASSAGLISNPKMSVYASSKWAALGWSDSLRIEMKKLKTNVGVTTVTPYYINTGMFDGVKSFVPILDQHKVARKIVRGIEKNRVFVSMPWSVHFVRFMQGLLPISWFDFIVGDLMGVYKTMNDFTGRK